MTLFTFLKFKNMCFLSGTIIFEDNDNRLFNLLTYGLFNNIENNCYTYNPLAKPHISLTHIDVFKKKRVESNEICFKYSLSKEFLSKLFQKKCSNLKCLKMELFLKKIDFLCDITTIDKDKNPNNESTKRVLLYYRFKHDKKQYLFFKLERYNMNSLSHVKDYINTTRNDTYDKRRENKSTYSLKQKDDIFYEELISNFRLNEKKIKIKIEEYNKELRTGNELFIFEELKEILLNTLLQIYSDQINDFYTKPIKYV